MRLLFALPGFHRVDRGAEVALLAVAKELALAGEDVTVIGSGGHRPGAPYHFVQVPSLRRENFEGFPRLPAFRDETAWEDLTFAFGLLRRFNPADFDATITCSFPYSHWTLRRPAKHKPAHFFVTQNGDWPARTDRSEYRFFDCEGLICTNPDYLEANAARWRCALIPNGVDLERFSPGVSEREAFGLPADRRVVLMVSALIPSKRVLDAIRAVACLDDVFLAVAGDGPQRAEAQDLADRLLPGRFKRLTLAATDMPRLYRSADVFLHLSETESFGNVFLEAWASGLPVVAHESPRLRWILGEGQYLCNTFDQAALISSLSMASASAGGGQPKSLQKFAWSAIADSYRRFIAETIEQRGYSPTC
ncbi:glycosyltransferase family 4 protein [Parafrankia sp. BMG5.11]|uniref:glycosyltransferase family 4 protein n=1 Tax=Parafrankia sp. BMG5.11 TaxID=222540 RepID=UPI00103E082C|nr:glycosyltransferase family 4 protein [Parafrankia sp. BMG5.11]TCJ34971.1 glycosyltransferase [Parafrankia sp. BMG5.11]